MKIAEAYYLNEEYIQADETYKNYLTFQPTGRHIHYVKYQLGRVNLAQFTGVDRDLEKIKEARGYFQSVVKDHPQSEHVADARKKLAETRLHLAERELYVGNYYLKEERYPAARERFENVLRDYADTPTAPKAQAALDGMPAMQKGAAESRVPADPPADPKAAVEQGATAAPTQLITKKGYDYEDPGRRSWTSYLNPFSWGRSTTAEAVEAAAEASVAGEASSSVAGTAAAEETAPAEKKKSWFSFLNPFASSEEKENRRRRVPTKRSPPRRWWKAWMRPWGRLQRVTHPNRR